MCGRLVSGRASGAAVYPPKLCRAILRGLANELRSRRHVPRRGIAVTCDEPMGDRIGHEMMAAESAVMHEEKLCAVVGQDMEDETDVADWGESESESE